MSTSFNLDPLDRITAGAVGEPGHRTFYLQARSGGVLLTLQAEKEQVHALATTVEQLVETLSEAGPEDEPPSGRDLDLEEPIVPEWSAGSIAIEYDDERDRIVIAVEELLPAESDNEPATAGLVATRAQARALARRALAVCAAGRPRCQLCGFPIEAEGHRCPALNGHRGIKA